MYYQDHSWLAFNALVVFFFFLHHPAGGIFSLAATLTSDGGNTALHLTARSKQSRFNIATFRNGPLNKSNYHSWSPVIHFTCYKRRICYAWSREHLPNNSVRNQIDSLNLSACRRLWNHNLRNFI